MIHDTNQTDPLREPGAGTSASSHVFNVLFGTVVNLGVIYTPKAFKGKAQMRGSTDGVAIWLKGLMDLLDEYNVDHPCEGEVRRELKGKRTCDTKMKQYFNVKVSMKKQRNVIKDHETREKLLEQTKKLYCALCISGDPNSRKSTSQASFRLPLPSSIATVVIITVMVTITNIAE